VLLQDTNDEQKPGRRIVEAGATLTPAVMTKAILRVTELQRNTAARFNDEAVTKQTPAEVVKPNP